MKNFKAFPLGLVLGIALSLSSLGFAQNATQAEVKKEAESCCAMTSSCCKGDSCDMKAHKAHKDQASKHEGCCCCGDSCDMKAHEMKEKPKS
jgi:hypothetical protein